jgi:hypothetical protein
MVAELLEITVEGCALLRSVNGVLGGIDIYDEPPFVSAPKEGFGGSAEHIFEGPQPLACCEDVVLKARQCRLAGSAFMLFPQGQPKRRVHPQVIGVIAILIACRNLIDPLAQQLEQRMIRMPRRSWIINKRLYTAKDT